MLDKQTFLLGIFRHLMLKTSSLHSNGLWNGKMGICLFFYRYADFSQNPLHSEFAGEILDEIIDSIDVNILYDFDNGIYGIAWGIDYLIRHGYVEADPDDFFANLDEKLYQRKFSAFSNSIEISYLKGVAYYLISRLGNRYSSRHSLLYDNVDLLCRKIQKVNPKDDELIFLLKQLMQIYNRQDVKYLEEPLHSVVKKICYDMNWSISSSCPLGISNNGLAGIGLKILEDLNI